MAKEWRAIDNQSMPLITNGPGGGRPPLSGGLHSQFTPATGNAGAERFTVGAVRARLSRLPIEDLDRAAAALTQEIQSFNHLVEPGERYLPVLEVFHSHVEGLLPGLLVLLNTTAAPVDFEMRQRMQAADALLDETARAYGNIVLQAQGLLGGLLRKRDLLLPIARSIELLSRRLLLAYQLYVQPPDGVWKALHARYALARRWKIAQLDLHATSISPESLYRRALLLAALDPAHLSKGELRAVREYIDRFGEDCVFHSAAVKPRHAEGLFIIDLDTDRPGVPLSRWRDRPRPRNGLMFSTRNLLRRLLFQYQRVSAGAEPAELGLPDRQGQNHYREFIRRLAAGWRGAALRRLPRQRFHPHAELFAGFPAAWAQLQIERRERAAGTPESSRPHPVNDWAIVNESPEGYALRHLSGSAGTARVGDLVLIRTRDQQKTFPCAVRWIRSEKGEGLEIGLQQMRGNYEPATFRGAEGLQRGQVPLLFAAGERDSGRSSVIAPARMVAEDQQIVVRRGSRETRWRILSIVESTSFFDVARLEAVG